MEEVQDKTEIPVFPQVCAEYQAEPWENQGVRKRVTELLWNSKHEEQYRRHQWMALSQNTYVYMETMEETENKGKQSNEDGSAKRFGVAGRKQPPRLLVHDAYSCRKYGNDKRKTDKQWLLRFSHSLSVSARQLLKAPYTERYVRCCERTGVSHSLLLD